MKKILALFSVLLVAIMVFACNQDTTTAPAKTTEPTQATQASTTTPTKATEKTTTPTSGTTATTATTQKPEVTTGLVVDLDFGAINNGVIKDKSNNGNDATLTGNATVEGGKITFTAQNTYLTIKNASNFCFAATDSFTLQIKFAAAENAQEFHSWPTLLSMGDKGKGWFGIWAPKDGFQWGGDLIDPADNTTNIKVGNIDTAEHTLTVIQDGKAGKIYIYFDNVLVKEAGAINHASTGDLFIGGGTYSGSGKFDKFGVQQFKGSVSEFKIYNYATEAPKAEEPETPEVTLPESYVDVDFGTEVTDANGKATFTYVGTPIVGDVEVTHNGVKKTFKGVKFVKDATTGKANSIVVGNLTELDTADKMNAFLAAGFSVEAFYIDNSSVTSGIVCMTESAKGFGIADQTNGKPYFITGSGSKYNAAYATTAATAGELVHVVATYDPTAKVHTIYVNGVECSDLTNKSYPGTNISGVVCTDVTSNKSVDMTNVFCLGGDLSANKDNRIGDFLADDLIVVDAKIYNKVLTAAEAKAAYDVAAAVFAK